MTTHFRIEKLHCESCIKFCTLKLKKLPGVQAVAIDLASGDATVTAERQVTLEQLRAALADTDYEVQPAAEPTPEVQAQAA